MSMKQYLLTAVFFMAAVGLSAQNKSAGINLSVWKGVATQPLDSQQTTYVNVGLYSKMNRVKGVSANALASVVEQEMTGIQVSGLSNVVGSRANGIQLSGLCNVAGGSLMGVSVSGLVNVAGRDGQGLILSGLTNVTGGQTNGVVGSGLMNVIGGSHSSGVLFSGISNIAGESYSGLMVSGLLNLCGEDITGLQLSGIGNFAGRGLKGGQVGLFNFATKAQGFQIGLINYYHKQMTGFQLGLVNANPDTRVQLMLFGGNRTKMNIAARFKNERFYTILGGGTHYFDFSDKFSATTFYRAGLSLPLCKGLSISGDLGYQHIESFKNKDHGAPARFYALQARTNLEYQLNKSCAAFVTGGYGVSRTYNQSRTYDKGVIVEAGIVLF